MAGYSIIVLGALLICLGYPASMISWRPGHALLALVLGAMAVCVGLGMLI